MIQLAYPYEDANGDRHAVDEVISVDDVTARDMVRDGMARWPDLEGRTVAELRALAADRHVDLGGAKRKEDIAKALEQAQGRTTGSGTPAGSTQGSEG